MPMQSRQLWLSSLRFLVGFPIRENLARAAAEPVMRLALTNLYGSLTDT